MQLKPDRQAFIWYGIGKSVIWYVLTNVGLIAGALIFFDSGYLIYALVSLVLSTIGVLYGALTRFIQYNKESYEILPDKIVYKSGSLFFDRQVDLPLAKVTLVEQVLPFIETSLFKTGNIRIETAGSGSTEVQFTSIAETDKIREMIEGNLMNLGMDLTKDELIQTEKPTVIGSILGTITWLLGSLAVLVWAVFFLGEFLPVLLIVVAGVLLLMIGIGLGVLRYLDFRRRQYLLYRGTIVYDEGFLTKKYAFIPLANLSDSETSQGLIHKIFGFYDIILSTRGTGNNISFQAMPGGKQLEQNVDELIKRQVELGGGNATMRAAKHAAAGQAGDVAADTTAASAAGETGYPATHSIGKKNAKRAAGLSVAQNLQVGNSYTKSIRLSIVKLLFEKFVGLIFLLPLLATVVFGEIFIAIAVIAALFVIPGLIFTLIGAVIQYFSNTYYIKESSVKTSYNFLTRSEKEFNLAKVTSLQVRRSWLDYILGTCSINFTSIGSSTKLSFKNIKFDQELIDQLRSKLRLNSGKFLRQIKPKFSIWQWFLAQFWMWVAVVLGIFFLIIGMLLVGEAPAIPVVLVLVTTILAIVLIISIIYEYIFAIRAALELHSGYIYRVAGIFVREHKFVPLNYVKDIACKKYFLLSGGQFRVNIAGDILPENSNNSQFQAQQTQRGQTGNASSAASGLASLYSNHLEMKYISDVYAQDQYLNETIAGGKLSAKPSYHTKPMPINETVVGVIFSFFLPFLLPLVAWRYLAITRMSYEVFTDRVVLNYGVIHSHRLTICYDQIDHLDQSAGLLNKIFNNGNVAIYTEGSSFVEMNVANIGDYKEFKLELEKHLEA